VGGLRAQEDASRETLTRALRAVERLNQAIGEGHKVMEGVWLCRDLVSAPPNMIHPQSFAENAVSVARQHGLEVRDY
jgi:leucyl aminopeptidase